ncbi:hypothetical protein ACRQ5Q_15245 [Bradyrhizobium sp. PMVTL-01]|uniref:Pam3-gp28 family putative phage holin n=1 Tax=Bradyrhizobium sp. PMVTL-01 TaxID=3434999 RepID=UPI003F71B079
MDVQNSLVKTTLGLVLRHFAGIVGAWLVSAGVTDASGEKEFVGAVMVLGALAWSFWQKVGHQKALELAQSLASDAKGAAKVLALVAFGLLAFSLLTPSVRAADFTVAMATPTKAPAYVSTCTVNNCTGWYAGIGLTGNGTNANIVGSGLNESVFAAGAQVDLHGGFQFWNGSYFAAVEAGIGYQFTNGGAIQLNGNQLAGYEIIKFGGSLSGLLNTSSSPIAIPTALSSALISPYFAIGAIQHNGVSQFATGAGAGFLLATNWDLDVRYMYAPAIGNATAQNLVTIGLDRHF